KALRNSSSAPAERIALLPFAGGVDIVLYEPSKGDYSRLQDIFSEYIYSRTMDESLSERVGAMLTEKGLTLSTAESCTAGLVSKLITDVPGSSQYFKGGVTAYSNEIKLRILDVDSEILDKHGAVSRQTAEAMAQGIRRLMKSDIGISVTGIAGPGGGTDDKPAGLVYMAVAFNKTTSFKYIFNGSRSSNRNFSAHYLLFNLYRRLR
ncbi:MAG: nicotinamide-nucleotide amidohydrolase family protein, partial [candidate division WOR-3 bacterium]|nr:nicotinamide-nucleotide amidohydrolase family protein [candidate division WOR-3 bacterium]